MVPGFVAPKYFIKIIEMLQNGSRVVPGLVPGFVAPRGTTGGPRGRLGEPSGDLGGAKGDLGGAKGRWPMGARNYKGVRKM